jgi:hypothetical protein
MLSNHRGTFSSPFPTGRVQQQQQQDQSFVIKESLRLIRQQKPTDSTLPSPLPGSILSIW